MFHIANRVYLDTDIRATPQYKHIIASERWLTHPIVNNEGVLVAQNTCFTDLLNCEFEGCQEKFWTKLLEEEDKLVLYLEPKVILRLQIQYWKSIFKDGITNESLHRLYNYYVESVRLRAIANGLGQWDLASNSVRVNEAILTDQTTMSLADFSEVADTIQPSEVLKAMDKRLVSFEYLLVSSYAQPRRDEVIYKELLTRVGLISWDNWLDEIRHIRIQVVSAARDLTTLDPEARQADGIERTLRTSKVLSWVLDPKVDTDRVYFRLTYDPEIFLGLLERIYYLKEKRDRTDPSPSDELETVRETVEWLYSDQYEKLLKRDIERGFGVSYCTESFLGKTNFAFATWVYSTIRLAQIQRIKDYVLRT